MKYFFCTTNKINMNNEKRKCDIPLKGGEKENGDILLLFLNVGAAPSSGGQNLQNCKLDQSALDGTSCIVDFVDSMNLKRRTAPKKIMQIEFNEDTCVYNVYKHDMFCVQLDTKVKNYMLHTVSEV